MNTTKETFSLRIERVTGEINSALISVLSTASTWLSPVPEAAMTTTAITRIFDLPVLVSVFVAASIELVGINVNSRYLEAKTFNDDLEAYKARYKAATYKHPPENASGALKRVVWFYVITGAIVAFTAFYDVFIEGDAPIKLLACLFPVTSAIGTLVANERAAFRRKLASISDNERADKAGVTLAKVDETPTESDENYTFTEPDYGNMETRDALLAFYSLYPTETNRKASSKVGVSPQRVGQILRELEAVGAIKRNGQGVEIL